MFFIYLYTLFFLFIVYILVKKNSIINNRYIAIILLINMIFISIYIIATTDLNYTDRAVYSSRFYKMQSNNIVDILTNSTWEPGFAILVKLISFITSDLIFLYIVLHLVFLYILLKGLKKIFSDINIVVLVFFIYLNYTIYYGYTLNGLRQGLSMALLILSIGYLIKNNKFKMIFSAVFAFMFHYTAFPLSLFIILFYFFNKIKIKYYLILYLFLSLLYILNLNGILFEFIIPADFTGYFNEGLIEKFGGSNKIQYLIFNSLFSIFILYFLKYEKYSMDEVYLTLIKIYLAFSIYFIMFGFVGYANRIASYSWFLVPLLVGLIIYKNNKTLFKISLLTLILFFGLTTIILDF